jgi:cell division protease FtsH
VAPQAKEEIHIHNRDQYMANIKVNLAAYAAEQIKYGTTGSGVSSDFRTAMNLAYRMVWHWGMGKSGYLGNMEEVRSYSSSYFSESYISQKTRETLDADVQEILQTCLNEAKEVLLKHRDLLDYFAQELLRKNELEYDEIEAIFNKFNLKPISGRPTITEFS